MIGIACKRQREAGQFADVDVVAFAKIATILLLVVLLSISSWARISWRYLTETSFAVLIVYYFFCALSAVWSPLPQYSFYRALEVVVLLFVPVLVLLWSDDFAAVERRALWLCTLSWILGIAGLVKVFGFGQQLRNYISNDTAACVAMTACYCSAEWGGAEGRRKMILILVGAFALVVLFVGQGSASMIATICGIGAVTLMTGRGTRIILVIIFVFLVRMLLYEQSVANLLFAGKETHDIASFHGRTYLWSMYFNLIKAHPVLGYGFAIGPRMADGYAIHAHNSLFAILLSAGGVGLFLFVVWAVCLAIEVFRSLKTCQPGSAGCLGAFIACGINCMTIPIIGEAWRASTLVLMSLITLHLCPFVEVQLLKANDIPDYLEPASDDRWGMLEDLQSPAS